MEKALPDLAYFSLFNGLFVVVVDEDDSLLERCSGVFLSFPFKGLNIDDFIFVGAKLTLLLGDLLLQSPLLVYFHRYVALLGE